MKFHIGTIQETSNENGKWRVVSKPPIKKWQLLVFPIGLFNLALLAFLWVIFTPAVNGIYSISFYILPIGLLLCLIGLLIVHEFIHTLFHPRLGFSKYSVIGFWPSKMLLYSIYNGEISRIRFIIILSMPFICISIIPLIIAIIGNFFNIWYAYITVVNAFVAAGDISEIIIILRQVPPNSKIKRKGWNYYWKKSSVIN